MFDDVQRTSLSSALAVIFLLLFPCLGVWGTEEVRETGPDWGVADIWYERTGNISCRVVNIAYPFTCIFVLNLSVDGVLSDNHQVMWNSFDQEMNITFEGCYAMKTPKLTVSVEIYDGQHMMGDVNRSNDMREETWEFDLPDLYVRSVFRDPLTSSAKAVIGNRGEPDIGTPFNVSLYLNNTLRGTVLVKDALMSSRDLTVDMGWVWDRAESPVELRVWADPNASVPELDDTDNNHTVIWEARRSLSFIEAPSATGIGTSNATLSWETSLPCHSEVRYGADRDMRTYVTVPGASEQGSLDLANLFPSTQYLFKVKASDAYGRVIESDTVSFVTAAPQGTGQTTGVFDALKMVNMSGRMRIPFTTEDPLGIRRVDYYIDGKFIGSMGGMGKTETHGISFDANALVLGEHTMKATVTTAAGAVTDFTTTFTRTWGPLNEFPKVNFTASSSLPRRGMEMLYARCTDPGGMVNATWEIDGAVVEVDTARYPDSSYFGPTLYWNTEEYSEGEHIVTIRVRNHDDNVTSVSRRLTVDNILPPPDPDVWVRREHIERDGSMCTVILNITNHGRGDAENILVLDNIKGFVPLDGADATRPINDECTEWEVILEHPGLESGETAFLEYRCIPIIYGEETWELGYMRPHPYVPDEEYTTKLYFERSDGMITFQTFVGIPAHNFEEGYTMYGGARRAISSSNYVMLTNPERLEDSMVFADGFHPFIAEVGELVALKTGVFMFVADPPFSAIQETEVLDALNDWSYLLDLAYGSSGYLAILGEDEIIPIWNYPDTRGEDDVMGSDQGYSNLDGGDEPRLIVGRILGATPEELLVPVRASINVHTGYYDFDPNGKALIMAGAGDGVLSFHDSAEDLYGAIGPLMDECVFIHRSEFAVEHTAPFAFDGVSRHFAVGDVNNDWDVEFVGLDVDSNEVLMKNRRTGGFDSFFISVSGDANLLVGDVDPRGGEEIMIIDGPFGASDSLRVKVLEDDGSELFRFDLDYGVLTDGKALADLDGDGYDELVVADSDNDRIRTISMAGAEIDSFAASGIRDDHRIAVADMDGDGDQDMLLADHQSDRIRVYLDPTWATVDIPVSGLNYADGFSAGEYNRDQTAHEEAVVIEHDSHGYLRRCTIWFDPLTLTWNTDSSAPYITEVDSDCAAVVVEADDDGGFEEIVIAVGGEQDTVLLLDTEGSAPGLKEAGIDEIWDSDLVVFRDHAGVEGWSGFASWGDAPDFHFVTMHNAPVMVGLACDSGRFHDNVNSFAQACMRNGAGVFIGSTEVSSRGENNLATSMVKNFVRGVPIGRAFRNWESRFLRDWSDLGTSEVQALYWVREYNLYGDPAFGCDASGATPPPPTVIFGTRGSYDHDISVPGPTFGNGTVGSTVSIEGGYPMEVMGEAEVPYVAYEFMVPSTHVVRSASLTMTGTWTVYEGLELAPYEGPQVAGGTGPFDITLTRATGTEDPEDRWYPATTMEWEVADGGSGNSTFVARVFPFQYDMEGRVGRFCPDWRLTVDVGEAPVTMEGLSGPKGIISPGNEAYFSFMLEPLAENVSVSVSQRIENGTGALVADLSASVLNLLGATEFEETWDTEGAPVGLYDYLVEIDTIEGAPVKSYRLPFRVGSASVDVTTLTLSTGTFQNGTVVYANTTYHNNGDVPLSGTFRITLFSPMMNWTGGINGTLDLGVGQSVSKGTSFIMTGLPDDIYTVVSSFFSVHATASICMELLREGTTPLPPPDHGVFLNYTLSITNLTEGGSVYVNGSVERDDERPFASVPVGAWIEGPDLSSACLTDVNGTFSLLLSNITYGNWTVRIRTLVGDLERSAEEDIIVTRQVLPPDDDDDVIDDDIVDDDVVDDDAVDDDDGGKVDLLSLIMAVMCTVLLVVLILLFIFLLLKKKRTPLEE